MRFQVVEEVRFSCGEKEVWYVVQPKSRIIRFLLPLLNYSPHKNKNDAIKECNLKNENKYDRIISKKVIKNEI